MIGFSFQLVAKFESEKDQIQSQMTKAIKAIQKYAGQKAQESAAASGTQDLIPEPETVNVQFSINKIPVKKEFRFNEIPVPFPVIDAESKSLCLFVRDPKEKAVAKVEAEKLPFEKVIAVKSLKRKYTAHEARCELANRFDLFFCDARIYEMMGKLLGKCFFEKKKAKIPSPMNSITKECFEKTIRTARFRVRGGNVVAVRIGHRGMDLDNLVANAMAVVEYMATKYCVHPKTLNNVYNIAVGATNVIDLPVWSVPAIEPKPVVPVAEESNSPQETQESDKIASVKVVVVESEKPTEAPKDLAAVPVKKLKAVQKQRAEEATQQLVAPVSEKKKRKTTPRS